MAATPTLYASGTKTLARGTFTVTIASPGVFSYTGHQLAAGDKVTLASTGALPTGLTIGSTYFVISAGLTADAFEVSATAGGSAINTSGGQSGTHSLVAECFLSSPNVAGVFGYEVDLTNMAAGDTFEARVYKMILTGGTAQGYLKSEWSGVQPTDDRIKTAIPVGNDLAETNALRFSLKQPLGAPAAVPWKVLQY